MRRLKAYRGIIQVIVCTIVFLGLNTAYGDVIGFKAFITQEQSLENSRLILSSRYMPIKEGNTAIVSKPLHYFKGRLITKNTKIYLEDGLISMHVNNQRLYRVFVEIKVLYLVITLVVVIVIRRFYDKFKEKKIKVIK